MNKYCWIVFLPGSQAETKSKCGSAVSSQTVEWSGVNVDILAFDAPFVSLADGPSWISSSQQQEPISSDGTGQNNRGQCQPMGSLHVEPFGRPVYLMSNRDTYWMAQNILSSVYIT